MVKSIRVRDQETHVSDFHGLLRGTASPGVRGFGSCLGENDPASGSGQLAGAGALLSGGHAPVQVWEACFLMRFHPWTYERAMGKHFSLTLSSRVKWSQDM